MGRTVSEGLQTSQRIAFGETIELVDGASVVDGLVKANGQILNKADFPELADFVATSSNYIDYTISAKTDLFVRPSNSVENIIAYNGNFYCFYVSAIDGSLATYWSMSPNGEDWTFPLLVNGSGTFNNVRVLGTSLFIMTSNGAFKFDGNSWSLFNSSITKDLAYNGANIWVGCNSTTTLFKSTDGVNWTSAIVTGNTVSIVWCGTNFLRTTISTTAYYSASVS